MLVQESLRQHAAGCTAGQALPAELQAYVLAGIGAQLAHIDPELTRLAAAATPLGAQLQLVVTIPGLEPDQRGCPPG